MLIEESVIDGGPTHISGCLQATLLHHRKKGIAVEKQFHSLFIYLYQKKILQCQIIYLIIQVNDIRA